MGRREFLKSTAWMWLAAATGMSAFGALDVSEQDGRFSVLRDGKTVLSSVSPVAGDLAGADVKTSFTALADGTRVWNRWCEDSEWNFRFEIADRADGAVEVTFAGHVMWDSGNRCRGLRIDIPREVFAGKRYESIKKPTVRYETESGVFGGAFMGIESRFLAVDGLLFDFNAYGPGDMNAALLDGWRHVDAMLGSYRIARGDGGGWKLSR